MTGLQVPVSLLLDPNLTASAKLVWLVIGSIGTWPTTRSRLGRESGLNHITVRRALVQLEAAGWYSKAGGAAAPPEEPRVHIPDRLLSAPQIGPRAKLIYGILQTVPEFRGRKGQVSYKSLGETTKLSRATIRQAVGELIEHRWLQIDQANQLAPVCYTLWAPDREQSEAEAAWAEKRLKASKYRGEAIMREYLSLLVTSDEFTDNARPGWLVNPQTNERLELDRYYPPKVAFEYNGAQHFETTDRYPDEVQLANQKMRDLAKEALCARRGVQLVTIRRGDLTLERMWKKVEKTGLPMRDLYGHEALVEMLEVEGQARRP